MRMYQRAMENVTDYSCAQNLVRDGDGSRTVGGSEFQRAARE